MAQFARLCRQAFPFENLIFRIILQGYYLTLKGLPVRTSFLILLSCLVLFFSCKKDDIKKTPSESNITSFELKNADGTLIETADISIVYAEDSIHIKLPPGTYLKKLIPSIKFSGKSVFPASEEMQNFSGPVTYTVTADDGTTSKTVVEAVIMQPTSIVYVGTGDGNLYALDAASGSMKWSFKSNGSFAYSSPTYKDGIIYEGSVDNYVYAVNSINGALIWKAQGGTTGIESDAICVDSTVYVGTNDDYLLALDAITGLERWRFQSLANISSSPLTANDAVYFGSSDGYFYAVNKLTGTLIWKFATGGMINQSGASLVDGILYFGSRDGNLYAVNAVDGTLAWKYDTGGISLEMSSPTVKDGVVYIGGWYKMDFQTAGSVYAVEASTGRLIWEKLQNVGFSSSPFVSSNRLFITGDDGNITALNTADGSILWQQKIYANSASPVEAHGIVYVGGSGTGKIYAFDAETGNIVWTFDTPNHGGLGTSSPIVIDDVSIPYYPSDSGMLY